MTDRPYTPIDCYFYDRLEEAATLRRSCEIRFQGPSGPEMIKDFIIDLRLVEKAEWMILASGLEIRLDDLIAFDGHAVPGHCAL